MLANRSSVKSFQDINKLEKKLASFKKEAKTTFGKFLSILIAIIDVVLAKFIVLFWKLKNALEAYYETTELAEKRRRARAKSTTSGTPSKRAASSLSATASNSEIKKKER